MATRYWIGDTGTWDGSSTTHWSATSGGSSGASVPTSTDDVIFDANSFSIANQVVTIANSYEAQCGSLNLSAVNKNSLFHLGTSAGLDVWGDFTGSSSSSIIFSENTLDTSNGLEVIGTNRSLSFTPGSATSFGMGITFEPEGNTITLLGNLTISNNNYAIQIQGTGGTFNANGYNLSARGYGMAGSPTIKMGSGTWTAKDPRSNPDGTALEMFTDTITLDAGTSTFVIDITDFPGAKMNWITNNNELTFYNLTVIGNTANKDIQLTTGDNTHYNNITITTGPVNVQFQAGYEFFCETLSMNGTPTGLLEITSHSSGDETYLNAKQSFISYVAAKDCYADDFNGGAIPFDDSVGGVDNGGNTNWCFTTACLAGLLDYDPSLVSAVKRVQQNLTSPRFVLAAQNSFEEYALFKKSDTYTGGGGLIIPSLWRSRVFQIGKNFDVLEITFYLSTDLTSDTSITPILYFDDQTSISAAPAITNVGTTYSNSNKLIKLTAKNFGNKVHGTDNFFLELQFSGPVLTVVSLPINISIEVEDV